MHQPLRLRAQARRQAAPPFFTRSAAQQLFRDVALVGARTGGIPCPQHQHPSPRPRLSWMQRPGKVAGPCEPEKAAKCQQWLLGRGKPVQQIAQLHGSARQGSFQHVKADRSAAVRDQQMLASPRHRDDRRKRPQLFEVERVGRGCRAARDNWKHRGIRCGAPDWAGGGSRQAWRLEGDKPPSLRQRRPRPTARSFRGLSV